MTHRRPTPAGFVHELFVHTSRAAWTDFVGAFISDGVAAGEPGLVVVGSDQLEWAHDAVGGVDRVRVVEVDPAATAATVLRHRQELVGAQLGDAATIVRTFAEMPHPGAGAYADEWARYEVAINLILEDLLAWGVCSYDGVRTPADHLDVLARCHPWVVTEDGQHAANPRYEPPATLWAALPSAPRDPLEATPPRVVLTDPSPGFARVAVQEATGAALAGDATQDLVMAVSEAVTNAHLHGAPPVRLAAWAGPGRAVVTVTDAGDGPLEAFTGLQPRTSGERAGGLGLWLLHQLAHVTHSRGPDGYTIRLASHPPGRPAG